MRPALGLAVGLVVLGESGQGAQRLKEMSKPAAMIRVTLPDASIREFPAGSTPLDVAAAIGRRLAKDAAAARIDGTLVDLRRPLWRDAKLEIVLPSEQDAIDVLRHSTAHVTAQAVQELFPGTKVGQGPVIENGFYYDFDRDVPFSVEDLAAIEARMAEIVRRDLPIERIEIPKAEAIAFFEKEQEPYKVYFATTKGEDIVTMYRQGDWVDFCRGPHLPSTGRLGAFKLLSVAGAYWLGEEKNKMLQRIYGTAFFGKSELEEYLRLIEEARKRDHRKLGRELDLFSFHPEAPASPFFHANGAAVYNLLISYVRDLYRSYRYEEVITPQIFDSSLWRRSGHYDHYRNNMYFTAVEEREFGLKPMNCPAHCLLFSEARYSYRDLPVRYADFGRLHRYELSGVTAGLTRVRSFSQDDAHIFCTPDQIQDEVVSVVRMILECYALFGFDDVQILLATRPENRAGDDSLWDGAELALTTALRRHGHPFKVNAGDGAFYGPKIDFLVRDALRRQHQLGTVQLDYVLPERFDLNFIDAQDRERRPVIIHRAMLGSLERFFAILIEHCGGAFPLWLAPEQVRVLSITERAASYGTQVCDQLVDQRFRARTDLRNEKIGAKIRDAQMRKVPFMLIVGDREAEAGTIAVRSRRQRDEGSSSLEAFMARARQIIEEKRNEP